MKLGDAPHELPFRGQVDEVRIWRIVRTAAEISAWRDQQLPPGQPGLIAYWSFDAGAGVRPDGGRLGLDLTLGQTSADSADPRWAGPGRP